ncbi:MAG: PAS domain S-box protein [Rhodobacterales bacterium]|nr:PAS domain S-box protein [Rhodobacterales bacterium]
MRVGSEDITDADILETVLSHFPDIVHSVDALGNIVFSNGKAQELLGYSREELLAMNISEIYADEVLDSVKAGFDSLKATGDISIAESLLKAKNGTRVAVEIRSFSIYDDNGDFARTISIMRDMRTIRKLQQSLIRSNRLTAIGEMAASVVHEITSPLTAILLSNDTVVQEMERIRSSETVDVGPMESASSDIRRASSSIQKLVEQLQNFSRGITEKYESVNIGSAVGDALFMTKSKVQACGVLVQNDIAEGPYPTYGSPNQLEQVFINLITNACDAMAGREERLLRLSIVPESRDGREFWRCTISDTGAGIAEEMREEVFESFVTTKQNGKGTGLGLSICRGIIKEHRGEITLESEVDKGTCFSILLRRA